MKRKCFWFLVITLLAAGFSVAGLAAGSDSPKAVTTSDPDVPLDELKLRLIPLTHDELKVEAEAWLKLLQSKATEISTAEIAVKYRKQELSKAEDVKAALSKAEEAKKALNQAATEGDKAAAEAEKVLKEAEKEVQKAQKEAQETLQRTSSDRDARKIETIASKKAEITKGEEAEESTDEREKGEKGEKKNSGGSEETQPLDDRQKELQEAVRDKEQTRAELLDYLAELRAQQTALIDHVNLVIDAYEKKGGVPEEIEQYRQYVRAVSGIVVDVSDTEATWATISSWLLSEEGGFRWLNNIGIFLIIVMISVFLSHLAARGAGKILTRSKQASKLLADFMVVTVRRTVLIVGILIGLSAMEVNVGPLLAVIGAAGFVIAFALQNSLGNFASGILVLMFRPFDVGDVIEVAGVLGKVESMNLLSILVRTPDNKGVIIPNNNVWSDSIINVTGTRTRRVDLVFGIAYDDDMGKAQKIMEQVVSEHQKILKDPEPVIRVHELGDSSVNFVCRPWVQTEDYWDVYWDLTRTVKERFDKEGISIPFPQRDVHLIQKIPG